MRPCADGDQAVACRIGSGGPVCSGTDNYTADARTGTPCKQSSECDIGYECVSAEEPGDGTCKPYCCDSTVCAALPAQAGSPVPFCDIENPISGVPSTGVPVCTAGPACTPLQTGACGAGMTCTVVSPSGQTACVTVGKAMEHQDCTTEKCGPNLACIVGTCVQLCDTGGTNTCPPYELCVAPTAFGSDSLIGVCTR
jgi:hypothetical protein